MRVDSSASFVIAFDARQDVLNPRAGEKPLYYLYQLPFTSHDISACSSGALARLRIEA
jgi:hypothetical protein